MESFLRAHTRLLEQSYIGRVSQLFQRPEIQLQDVTSKPDGLDGLWLALLVTVFNASCYNIENESLLASLVRLFTEQPIAAR